jgi:hypothetical protein
VRARIKSRYSASPASTVSINRPCDVVVSAHVPPRDLKPAFLLVTAASVFNRSQRFRGRRFSGGGDQQRGAGQCSVPADRSVEGLPSCRRGNPQAEDQSAALIGSFWHESSATEPGGTARDGRAQEPGVANIPAMPVAGIAPLVGVSQAG